MFTMYSKIIQNNLMSYLSCSQIWLHPLVDGCCQCGYTTKMKKKKKPWNNNRIIQKICYIPLLLLLLALPTSFLYPTHLHKYETNVGTFKQI
jgi:hypothetical protein